MDIVLWEGNVRAFSYEQRLEAVDRLGCVGMSASPVTIAQWESEGHVVESVVHLDPLVRWNRGYRDENLTEELRQFSTTALDDFLAVATRCGVASVTLPAIVERADATVAELAADFADVCDAFAPHGIRCDLEFLPYWSGVPDLPTACEIVVGADRANGAVLFDVYHFVRSGGGLEQLRDAPADVIAALQVNDGPLTLPVGTDEVDDMLNERMVPGRGAFPLHEILDIVTARNDVAVAGAEIFSRSLDARPFGEVVDIVRSANRDYLTST